MKDSLLYKDLKSAIKYASIMFVVIFLMELALSYFGGMQERYSMSDMFIWSLQFASVFAMAMFIMHFSLISPTAFIRADEAQKRTSIIRSVVSAIFIVSMITMSAFSFIQVGEWNKKVNKMISVELIPSLKEDKRCQETFLLEAYEDGDYTVVRCGNRFWIGFHEDHRIPTSKIEYSESKKL